LNDFNKNKPFFDENYIFLALLMDFMIDF